MAATPKKVEPFSKTFKVWLNKSTDKTVSGLIGMAGEKAFALIFLVMMALPALPIPTGGITHVTELIVILGSLQLIIGRQTIWLPKKWLKLNIGKILSGKGVTKFIAVIAWFERFSRLRWSELLKQRVVLSFIGIVVTIFTLAAFVAPPFSGLDTLPALGVVVISLSLILEDALLLAIGIAVGAVGIGVEIAAGTALYAGFTHLFH